MNHFIETLLFFQFYENIEPWLEERFKAIDEGPEAQPCGQVVRFNELDVTYQITKSGVVRLHVDWLQHRAYGQVYNFHREDDLALQSFKDTFKEHVSPKKVKSAKFNLTQTIKANIPKRILDSMESGELTHYQAVYGTLNTPFSAFVQPRIRIFGGRSYELVFSFQTPLGGYKECVIGDLETA